MAQIFHRSANSLARMSILGGLFILVTVGAVLAELQRSPYVTRQHEARVQTPPFSHQHHVGGMGLDCRYCHTSVEDSNFAGIPPTKTCMNCHAQIWSTQPMLEPVRQSYATGKSLEWIRVHDLPDFVYFDHSIHINKGVGCQSCHGQVDKMPLMYMEHSLQMEWCLSCHREPEKYIRPKTIVVDGKEQGDQVFSMKYEPPSAQNPVTAKLADGSTRTFTDQLEMGTVLRKEYSLRKVADITSCSTCHR
ncbi:MAG TPA: cytochrome c3 family protein [Terriglobales bacterium]|jgi:hypothetical protein|nr:cytochrome c3 family protein [Terriglobales bacterium]